MRLRWKMITLMTILSLTLAGCGLSSANRNYNKGLTAFQKMDYEAAKEYFERSIESNSEKAEYHMDYGFTLIALGQYESAREEFHAVILDKDIKMVKENNKKALRGIGITYLGEEAYELAIENFDKALEIEELKDLDVDILYYKASTLERAGRLSEAADCYTSLIERNVADAAIYSARANIYRMIGNYELSITDYDQAIKLSPQDFNLYLGQYASLMELSKTSEAKAVLAQAAMLPIDGDDDKYELAKVHFYQGEYEIALHEFTTLIDKGYTQGYYFMGEISLQYADYETALTYFKSYMDSGNKVFGQLYQQMLTCSLQLKQLTEAKGYLEQAKKMQDVTYQDQLLKNEIIYYEKTGDYNKAYRLMATYLKKYPEDVAANKDYYFLKTRVEGASQVSNEEVIVVKP